MLRSCSVHPHACGELPDRVYSRGTDAGSSPRMWGTLHDLPARDPGCRFIPTHVGNSYDVSGNKILDSVHPHACGELLSISKPPLAYPGSSPRMWGTPFSETDFLIILRFIPTHVGNSPAAGFPCSAVPVHPHACGELTIS